MTLRALAEVDPTCVSGLITYGVTTLNALRENVSFEKVKVAFLMWLDHSIFAYFGILFWNPFNILNYEKVVTWFNCDY